MSLRLVLVVVAALTAAFVRWFVRTAAGAKGYYREPRPDAVAAEDPR